MTHMNEDDIIASARSVVEAGITLLSTKGALQKYSTGEEEPIPTTGLLGTMCVNFNANLDEYRNTKSEASGEAPMTIGIIGKMAIEAAMQFVEEQSKNKDSNA